MSESIHITDNRPFILRAGARIVIPPGVTHHFISPRLRNGARYLPCMACLQLIKGENNSPTRYRFAETKTNRGFKLFLPSELKAGDHIVVIWREARSAAAVQAHFYPIYRAFFDESEDSVIERGPFPEGWD